MIYRVDPKIFEQYPNFFRGVVVASTVDNTASNHSELDQLLRQRIREIELDESISVHHERIEAWSDIYASFPLKDKRKIQPSVGALVQRIKKGKGADIPFISPLVCISNLISLTHIVPSGLIDAESVQGDLVLGYARGDEVFSPIGSNEILSPEPGEIIYYDSGSKNVMCRAWNSRGGKATFILPTTKIAVIDVDGLLTVISRDEIETATNKIAMLVNKYCSGQMRLCFLNQANQAFEI